MEKERTGVIVVKVGVVQQGDVVGEGLFLQQADPNGAPSLCGVVQKVGVDNVQLVDVLV
jgi:hypothetical protein